VSTTSGPRLGKGNPWSPTQPLNFLAQLSVCTFDSLAPRQPAEARFVREITRDKTSIRCYSRQNAGPLQRELAGRGRFPRLFKHGISKRADRKNVLTLRTSVTSPDPQYRSEPLYTFQLASRHLRRPASRTPTHSSSFPSAKYKRPDTCICRTKRNSTDAHPST